MRLLYVSDVYFPRVNGVSTSIQTFRRELAKLGHETLLVAPAYPNASYDEPDIVRVASRYIPADPEDRAMRWRLLTALKERLGRSAFDLVHIQTPFLAHYAGLAFGRAWGVPCVATYHTLFEEYLFHYVPFAPKEMMRGIARRFSRGQCNALDAVVVPSSAMLRTLSDYGVIARTKIVPTGLRLEEFEGGDGSTFRARHGIPPDRPTLGFVGRVAFEKNIDFLLRMLAKVRETIPDILLVITGEGPAERSLKRLVEALGLEANVIFLGYLERSSTLLDCYRGLDAFVFASRTETQGLVLLEAMAVGTPVVSTAVMGTRDILRDGEGVIVAEDDEDRFAEAVIRMVREPGLRDTLSRSARAHAESWSAWAMARRMGSLYESVIAESARAGLGAERRPA